MRLLKCAVSLPQPRALGCNETRRQSTPCGQTEFSQALEPDVMVDDVDVLFVIDNTHGAQERLVLLTSPGHRPQPATLRLHQPFLLIAPARHRARWPDCQPS